MAATSPWFSKLHTESCILIRDVIDCPGNQLWRYFLESSGREKDTKNVVLQLQGSPDPAANATTTSVKWPDNTTVIPFINDIKSIPVDRFVSKLLDSLPKVKSSSRKTTLYIDNLNSLIALFDLSTICSILEEFTSKYSTVVALVSSELLSIQLSTALTRLSSVIIRLQPYPSHKCIKVDVTLRKEHRRLGLRVEKKELYIRFNSDRAIEYINVTQPLIQAVHNDKGDLKHRATDELSKMTFNLNLTESEKHARSNVQLPYVNVKKESDAKVIYTPDEFDDIDEEDPDDDLGI